MMKKYLIALWVATLMFSTGGNAKATPITIGSLSSNDDGSTNIITDSLNDYEWLRWDALSGKTYAETLSAISVGGAYEGFSFAHNVQGQMFVEALLGTNTPCTTTNPDNEVCMSGAPNSYRALTGENHGNFGWSLAWFFNDNLGQNEVGYVAVNNGTDPRSQYSGDNVHKFNSWYTLAYTDEYTPSGTCASLPSSWLLYRDVSQNAPVPEPATMFLFGTGLVGLAGVGIRRKKKA